MLEVISFHRRNRPISMEMDIFDGIVANFH